MLLNNFISLLNENEIEREVSPANKKISHKEKRAAHIKGILGGKWNGLGEYPANEDGFDAFLNAVASVDPTQKGNYMQWIATKAINDPIGSPVEKLPMIREILGYFDSNKASLGRRDINQYKSFEDLASIMGAGGAKVTNPKEAMQARLVAKFAKDWKQAPEKLNEYMKRVAETDPTSTGIYMEWIATLGITKPSLNKEEDLPRVSEMLAQFDVLKSSPKIAKKNINLYKAYYELTVAVRAATDSDDDVLEDAEEKMDLNLVDMMGIHTVYYGDEGWVMVPTTEEGSIHLAKNTEWCTGWTTRENHFARYHARDYLFVIYDRSKKERTQLHIRDNQYMDKDDVPKGFQSVPKWAWPYIAEYYRENADANMMTPPQLRVLQQYTGQNFFKDTVHQKLFDMAGKYGLKLNDL